MKECFWCGRPASDKHHLIPGTANRKNSEKYNLTCYLCRECHRKVHDDPDMMLLFKCHGQALFEQESGTREDFISIFGKSYLGVNE